MNDARDQSFDRALEAALGYDALGTVPAMPLRGELADLVDTARHVRRLQALPAPAGLADRLAERLSLETNVPGRLEPVVDRPGPPPQSARGPSESTRLPLAVATLIAVVVLVWLALDGRPVDGPSSAAPTIAATASSTATRAQLTASATHSPQATSAATSPRPTLPVASAPGRDAIRPVSPTPTAELQSPIPEPSVQDEPTDRSSETPVATSTPTKTALPTTAVPSRTPVIEPSQTEPPPTVPPVEPTKKPTEPREASRTPTPPRDVTATPVGEPTVVSTEAPTRAVDPGIGPTNRH